jgi:hypothetical protein
MCVRIIPVKIWCRLKIINTISDATQISSHIHRSAHQLVIRAVFRNERKLPKITLKAARANVMDKIRITVEMPRLKRYTGHILQQHSDHRKPHSGMEANDDNAH